MCPNQKVSNPLANVRTARSVLDFETNDQLRDALKETPDDWVLEGYNPASTQIQTLEQEYHRLLTLKSYDLLDIESDKTLERMTAMTGRVLNCPIAYVGTMDLGRYNILAGKGLGTIKNVCRRGTFCEHAVQSNKDVIVFEDASKDPYMKDNWFVHDGPQTRFYAAAKLVGPENCVLGTLCVIDPEPRPGGLSLADKQNLCELADMVMDYMVQRRKTRMLAMGPAQQVASAAHDLITPLTGIDCNLTSLKDDTNLSLTDAQQEQLENATRCVSVVKGICRELLRHAAQANQDACCRDCKDDKNLNVNQPSHVQENADAGTCLVKIDKLLQKISTVIEHHPKQVPLMLSVQPGVPNEIMSHGLTLFRSALNLLTRACSITNKGSIQLRVSQENDDSGHPMILFECQDTGPAVPVQDYPKLLAEHVIELGGNSGYRPLGDAHHNQGSVFWFRVPLVLPEAKSPTPVSASHCGQDKKNQSSEASSPFPSVASEIRRNALNINDDSDSPPLPERTKMALIIEDTMVIRKVLAKCLSKLGFEVTQAENGFVGLQKLKSAKYDLALCDFLMPVLDGVDCVEQFRAWEATHRQTADFQQYIVGISAHCQSNDIQLGIKAGMNDFRPKPVTRKHLEELAESSAVKEAGEKLNQIVAAEEAGATISSDHGGEEEDDESPPLPMFNCLIGAESNSDYFRLVKALNPKKWKVVTVHDGTDALQLLKIQNWDLVILDDELPRLSGTRCAMRFREWEKCHRINRQRNMVLASAYLNNGAELDAAKILLPFGFEQLMEKPYTACEKFIHQVEANYSTTLTGVNIIAH